MKTLIGFDLVDCARCKHWASFSDRALLKIFSPEEITYCRSERVHSASRFAVRFAAREALYKALSSLQYNDPMPLVAFCQAVHVIKLTNKSPEFRILEEKLQDFYALDQIAHISLSLSHTATTAGAVVAITLRP